MSYFFFLGEDGNRNCDNEPLASHDELEGPYEHQMALYEDDLQARGKISQILNRIANYQAGIEPNMTKEYSDKDKQAKLGTLFGVYLPTIQNIFGVLLFIRMTWIVGMAGLFESLGIVVICCLTTMLTAISMSAIATNGVVPAGGSYFMISRALGPEFGGAVGILFYLGTTVASSMYIIGSVEILLKYMAPQISLFGDVTIEANALSNYRVYGTMILLLLSVIVFIGVKFVNNLFSRYTMKDRVIGQETHGNRLYGEVVADITSSFMVLMAIYFPSVTGIMAGSNRSGDLADASRSIPVGTICAIITTSFVYFTSVIFFAAIIEGDLMRDKFGESIDSGLVVAKLSWPNEWVILIGSFLSTLGAGLQSLTGAPRLLQAIGCDGVLPFLNIFSVTTKRGEPFRALVMTVLISEIGICIANLDYVAPIITMFFLMCYGFVNMACALQTLLRTPSWRPRFQFYHWTLSLLGLALCITLMFISSWYYALTAIVIAALIYKYIEYKGAEKEWGDGIRGLAMSAARYSLLRLQQGPPHTKNWRPQLLVLMKMDSDLTPKYPKMVNFASQLKAGKGLTLLTSVLPGEFSEKYADAQAAKQSLNKLIETTGIKGFADVVIAKDVTDGLCHLIQNAGLGGLRHNTVMIGWPYGWRHSGEERSHKVFIDAIKNINAGQMALLAVKGINQFPDQGEKLSGTVDIWWIVHDGGMLMLLPFLLKQHRTFKNCKLRIFTVAHTYSKHAIQERNLISMILYLVSTMTENELFSTKHNKKMIYAILNPYKSMACLDGCVRNKSQVLKQIKQKSSSGCIDIYVTVDQRVCDLIACTMLQLHMNTNNFKQSVTEQLSESHDERDLSIH
ncbi:solute carrier family 12 (potassium/chloride transporter), member 4/5/6, partial [Mytilus galloprovincialis]